MLYQTFLDFNKLKTFIVSKPNSKREKECIEYLKQFNIKGIPFYGLKGSNCGLSTEYLHNQEGDSLNSTRIATGLSHFFIWSAIKWIHEQSDYKDCFYFIVEDDVEFLPDWQSVFLNELKNLPENWEMLYIGSCHAAPYQERNNNHIKGNIYKLNYAMCTHAYFVNYEGVKKLLKTNERVWTNIDIQMLVDSFPIMNAYAIFPRLAIQNNMEIQD